MLAFIEFLFIAFAILMIGLIIWSCGITISAPAYRKKLDEYAKENKFSIKDSKKPFAVLYKHDVPGIAIASRNGLFGSELKVKLYEDVFITKLEQISLCYFIADDRANAFHIIPLCDEKSDVILGGLEGEQNYRKIPYEKVLRVEISVNGKVIYEKENAVGRALVGGALFGAAGAIVGSTSATTSATTEETANLRILVDNIENPSIVISGLDVNKAENVKDIIDVVLNRFQKERVQLDVQDSESKISSKIQNECANTNDLYAQLEKLGQLKEKGILTEEEFKQQKEKILNP